MVRGTRTALALGILAGCAGQARPNLSELTKKNDVKSVYVGLAPNKALCPGEQGQLVVRVELMDGSAYATVGHADGELDWGQFDLRPNAAARVHPGRKNGDGVALDMSVSADPNMINAEVEPPLVTVQLKAAPKFPVEPFQVPVRFDCVQYTNLHGDSGSTGADGTGMFDGAGNGKPGNNGQNAKVTVRQFESLWGRPLLQACLTGAEATCYIIDPQGGRLLVDAGGGWGGNGGYMHSSNPMASAGRGGKGGAGGELSVQVDPAAGTASNLVLAVSDGDRIDGGKLRAQNALRVPDSYTHINFNTGQTYNNSAIRADAQMQKDVNELVGSALIDAKDTRFLDWETVMSAHQQPILLANFGGYGGVDGRSDSVVNDVVKSKLLKRAVDAKDGPLPSIGAVTVPERPVYYARLPAEVPPAVTKEQLVGRWSGCHPDGYGVYGKRTWTFDEAGAHHTYEQYAGDPSCRDPKKKKLVMEGGFASYELGASMKTGLTAVDVNVKADKITIHDDKFVGLWNEYSGKECGKFKKGQTVDLAGKTCFGVFHHADGTKLYDALVVNNGELRFGVSGSERELADANKRPYNISSMGFTREQAPPAAPTPPPQQVAATPASP